MRTTWVLLNMSTSETALHTWRVAVRGVADQVECQHLRNLFATTKHWQQPWQMVDEVEQADFLLVATEYADTVHAWLNGHYGTAFTPERLIVYGSQVLASAAWYLERPRYEKRLRALDLISLLYSISRASLSGSLCNPMPVRSNAVLPHVTVRSSRHRGAVKKIVLD